MLARNWRVRAGELDIVARDGEWLVFVEVRARSGDAFGSPEESITRRKKARLAALAQTYLLECGWDGLWRIDVIGLRYGSGGEMLQLDHWRDAVQGAS